MPAKPPAGCKGIAGFGEFSTRAVVRKALRDPKRSKRAMSSRTSSNLLPAWLHRWLRMYVGRGTAPCQPTAQPQPPQMSGVPSKHADEERQLTTIERLHE